ncbi:MAG: HAMP domain-containing histidine kinase [Lachnospiraceae bacterium]|nr:HAMP domain-containing histidine kinase [Lachnospiraceae bacterium]
MKFKSIKARVSFTFILLMAFALIAISIVNMTCLGDVYLSRTKKALEKSFDLCNANNGKTSDEMETYCQVNGFIFGIADENLDFLYTNSQDGERMASRLFGNVLKKEDENTTVIEQKESYQIIKIHDRFLGINYLELWGTLDNGDYYIVLTPLESIDAAAGISTRFDAVIGIILIGVSVIVILLLTRNIVRPLQELTELSKKMANLDFNAHYTSGGEDEIGELGKNFNTMSEQLEQAISELKSANAKLQKDIDQKTKIDEMRQEFLSNVSHELKTPLALILGYAEGLKDNVVDEDSRDFYCDVIIDESQKMDKMVRKLLSLNQLEFGNEQLNMQRFDLTDLVKNVLQAQQILIGQKDAKVEFCVDRPVYVWGDTFKIEEVVTNYLTNALNHLGGERIIRISMKEENGTVTTSVFNTGEPIPEESLDQIWVKFYKVDKARTRAYGGSGIGLSIVRAIMDSHGQKCWAENREDGVEFYFTLDTKVRL